MNAFRFGKDFTILDSIDSFGDVQCDEDIVFLKKERRIQSSESNNNNGDNDDDDARDVSVESQQQQNLKRKQVLDNDNHNNSNDAKNSEKKDSIDTPAVGNHRKDTPSVNITTIHDNPTTATTNNTNAFNIGMTSVVRDASIPHTRLADVFETCLGDATAARSFVIDWRTNRGDLDISVGNWQPNSDYNSNSK